MPKKINSLYVHIPFCAHICHYCDFTKLFYNQQYIEPYLEALFYEIDSYHIDKVDTIYIGGGTPTSLKDDEFEKLLAFVSKFLNAGGEFSVEANVENLSLAKLLIMKRYNVSRLSIGIESTNDERLKSIGRHHTFLEAQQVIKLAQDNGFDNINVDLIYGFPGESFADLQSDLKSILTLNSQHISIYSLIVNKGTIFANQGVQEQNQDEGRIFYDEILKELRAHGYERYEISNFAKSKHYARHNLVYWHDEEYYGVGLGASGYVDGVRYTNSKSLSKYLAHQFIEFSEKIDSKAEIEDFLLCNFRLEQGFLKEDFKKRFGVDFAVMFKDKLEPLIKNKLIIINNDRIMLSDDGLIIMDRILLELL